MCRGPNPTKPGRLGLGWFNTDLVSPTGCLWEALKDDGHRQSSTTLVPLRLGVSSAAASIGGFAFYDRKAFALVLPFSLLQETKFCAFLSKNDLCFFDRFQDNLDALLLRSNLVLVILCSFKRISSVWGSRLRSGFVFGQCIRAACTPFFLDSSLGPFFPFLSCLVFAGRFTA